MIINIYEIKIMTLKINDNEVELRFTFNAFIEYEKHFNEPLSIENFSLDKTLWFYYFVVLCSKKGWQTSAWLSKDDFDEWLNDDPTRLQIMNEFTNKNLVMNDVLTPADKKK